MGLESRGSGDEFMNLSVFFRNWLFMHVIFYRSFYYVRLTQPLQRHISPGLRMASLQNTAGTLASLIILTLFLLHSPSHTPYHLHTRIDVEAIQSATLRRVSRQGYLYDIGFFYIKKTTIHCVDCHVIKILLLLA